MSGNKFAGAEDMRIGALVDELTTEITQRYDEVDGRRFVDMFILDHFAPLGTGADGRPVDPWPTHHRKDGSC